MRTRAVALAFLACFLSSVGGRRVKDKVVDGDTLDKAASLAESERSIAKKPINPAAILLLALDPATAFSSPALPGRFGSLVKENVARMTTMQSSYPLAVRRGGMSYDDSMYDDMSRPALGFGGSTQDMIKDNTWQRGTYYRYDDYGSRGTGSMYGRRGYGYGGYGGGYGGYGGGYGRRGYGNMYGRRGYGGMYGDRYDRYGMRGYGGGGYGRYGGGWGRYNDYGYGGYGSNYGGYGGYGNGYRRRGYGGGGMYDDMYRGGYGGYGGY